MQQFAPTDVPMSVSGIGVEKFSGFQALNTTYDNTLHGHDFIEILFVVSGEVLNTIDGTEYRQKAGEAAVINYGSMHTLHCRQADLYNVYLDMNRFRISRLAPAVSGILNACLLPHPRLVHARNRVCLIQLSRPQFLFQLLERMCAYTAAGSEQASVQLLYAAQLLLAELAVLLENRNQPAGDEPDRISVESAVRIDRVIGMIESRYREQLPLSRLADAAGCTVSHLCRVFKEQTGRTIGSFILERRLQQALFLLETTTEKVLTVALNAGFTDISQFNRKFKEYTGMTATVYRRNVDWVPGSVPT
jgi:AraC-like DNA-binding protein